MAQKIKRLVSLVAAARNATPSVVGGNAAISSLTITDNAAGTSTHSRGIGGPGVNQNNIALVFNGSSTFKLNAAGGTNADNTYIGGTTIQSGTLIAAQIHALGDVTSPVLLIGGTLDIQSGTAVAGGIAAYNVTIPDAVNVNLNPGRNNAGVGFTQTLGGLNLGLSTLNVNNDSLVTSGTATLAFSGTTTLTSMLTGTALVNPGSANLSLGAVTGAETAGNIDTLQLDGNSPGNAITGAVSNGTSGGQVALYKNNSSTWTLSGNSTFTGGTVVDQGTLVVSHPHGLGQSTTNGLTINNTALVKITTGTGAGPVVLPSLSINGGASPVATLDLTSSKMVLTNTSYASAVSAYTVARAQVTNALDGFAWDQPGITSSTVANDINNLGVPTSVAVILNNSSGTAGGGAGDASDELFYSDGSGSPTTNPNGLPQFAGTSVDQNSILFKYTYIGDSNLDGMVDSTDFGLFLAGYNDPGTAASLGWAVGDYDYSGTVDSTDFGLFLAGYNYYASNPIPLNGAGGVQPVPEPAALVLAVLGLAGLAGVAGAARRRSINL